MDLAVASEEAAAFKPEARQALAECFTLAEQIAAEVRTLSYLLHPPLLDESGLASAIRWYADGLAQRSGLHVKLEVPPEVGRLPPERETTLFRIVQESLSNVLLHSGSKKANIRIVQDTQQVTLEVSDEGRGLAPGTLDQSHPGLTRLTKNDGARTLPLTGEVLEMLRILRQQNPHSKLVFTHNGQPIRHFEKSWKSACVRAGMPGLLFHDLRRTGVRNLIRAGVPERVAMAISGHKTRTIFDRYNIVSERDLHDASRKLENYLSEREAADTTTVKLGTTTVQ